MSARGLPELVIRLLDDNLAALASGRLHSSLNAEQVKQMFPASTSCCATLGTGPAKSASCAPTASSTGPNRN